MGAWRGFGVREKCSSDLALNKIHLHLKNCPCGSCTSRRRAGCPFQRKGGRAATIPGFHQLSSFPSLVHTPQQAREGLQIFGFLGFGQTHGITASTCPHPHTGWEKASSQSSLCRADGVALPGTKFGIFGLLLCGGCSWQDVVQCQAGGQASDQVQWF